VRRSPRSYWKYPFTSKVRCVDLDVMNARPVSWPLPSIESGGIALFERFRLVR